MIHDIQTLKKRVERYIDHVLSLTKIYIFDFIIKMIDLAHSVNAFLFPTETSICIGIYFFYIFT